MIPAWVMKRDDLTLTKKALFGKIYSFTFHTDRGVCDASNAFLGRQIGIGAGTASNYVSELVDLGLVRREVDRDKNQQVRGRRLWAVKTPPSPSVNGDPSPSTDGRDGGDSRTVEQEVSDLRSSTGEAGQEGKARDQQDGASPTDRSPTRPSGPSAPNGAGQGKGGSASPPPDQRAPGADADTFDALTWLADLPGPDARNLRDGRSRHLAEGVHRLLWLGTDPPDRAPAEEWSVGAELRKLAGRVANTSARAAAEALVGLAELRDRGELPDVAPDEGITLGYLDASTEIPGRALWSQAREVAQALERAAEDGGRDPRVDGLLEELKGEGVGDAA